MMVLIMALVAPFMAASEPLPWEGKNLRAAPPPLAEVVAQSTADRAAAAANLAQDNSATGIALLWLLAHDPDLQVRMLALTSALQRCPKEAPGTCMALVAYFNEENDAPGAWLARDALLREAEGGPSTETLSASKLELIARLMGVIDRPHAPKASRAALRLMAEDEDPEVQEAAGAALMAIDR